MTMDISIPRTQTLQTRKGTHANERIECACYRANLNVALMPDRRTPETHMLAACLKESLQAAVGQLPLLEQYVLEMYFGIGDAEPMGFCAISLIIGGNERGAKHIYRNAMRKLRQNMFKSIIFERSDKLLLTEAVCAEL